MNEQAAGRLQRGRWRGDVLAMGAKLQASRDLGRELGQKIGFEWVHHEISMDHGPVRSTAAPPEGATITTFPLGVTERVRPAGKAGDTLAVNPRAPLAMITVEPGSENKVWFGVIHHANDTAAGGGAGGGAGAGAGDGVALGGAGAGVGAGAGEGVGAGGVGAAAGGGSADAVRSCDALSPPPPPQAASDRPLALAAENSRNCRLRRSSLLVTYSLCPNTAYRLETGAACNDLNLVLALFCRSPSFGNGA